MPVAGAGHPLSRRLLPREVVPPADRARIERMALTHPSLVLYGQVKADAVPPGTMPVEMFVDNMTALDESEVTMYVSSLEDPSLCPEGTHVFTLIGPSMSAWPRPADPAYPLQKKGHTLEFLRTIAHLRPR